MSESTEGIEDVLNDITSDPRVAQTGSSRRVQSWLNRMPSPTKSLDEAKLCSIPEWSAVSQTTPRRGSLVSISAEDEVILHMTPEVGLHEEVEIGEHFLPEEVRIMVGRNRVRIIAEHRVIPAEDDTKEEGSGSGSLPGSASSSRRGGSQQKEHSIHKVVQIPAYIDSYSLRSVFRDGYVIITGDCVHQKRKWSVGQNGHLAVREDGSVRMTLDLPPGVATDQVSVTTVTKRYLVVTSKTDTARTSHDATTRNGSTSSKNFLDTYELPDTCDVTQVETRSLGGNTLIVEVGAKGHRPRSHTY